MFRTRHPIPGSPPAMLTASGDAHSTSAPILKFTEYSRDGLTERVLATVAELPDCLGEDGRVYWLDINGLGDVEVLNAVGQKYQLHPLALEDVLHMGQRPKMEAYENNLFIVADMVYCDEAQRMCGEQVSFFLGRHLLITLQEEVGHDVFEPVRQRIRSGRGYIRKMGCDYLAYALLDSIIDHYYPVLEGLGDGIEELENEVLAHPSSSCVSQIHQYKRTLMQLRRFIWPMRDVITALLHDESALIQPATKVFLRDCYDHTVQLMDLIESYRDVNSGLMELYLSAVTLRTNEIMRVLTIMSSIFIPLTFVAGVYGMNFDNGDGSRPLNMPELYHPYGYVICLIFMALVACTMLFFFRRKKWL